MKLGARLFPWLGRVCVGVTFAALSVAACSVPQFEFPGPPQLGTAGDGNVVIPHCENGLLDGDVGESDFDCGGGCAPCALGQHCGSVADCAEGLCHEGTCIAEGCMNQVQDGVETDVDCGGGGCNKCITGQACGVETDCDSGVCADLVCLAPACDDQVQNGKETGTDCGGGCAGCAVDQPCISATDCISLDCTDGICGPECPDGFANCNKQNADACETNTRTDLANCGGCGKACDLPHATAECSAGECHVATDGCEAGFADCNGLPADGCEVNLQQDKLNCGVCNKACPELNGAPFCDAGLCQITCTTGFDDCDDNRDNGCEKDVSKDVNNCGECNKKCTPSQGGTAYCKNDACGETICPAGFGDCNGEPDDGCEVDLRIDAKNCNTCGNLCVVANGTATCNNKVCQIKSCDAGFDNCSGGYADGCETDLNTSTAHCGNCATPCSVDNGVPKCDMGACAINNCNGTFRDCNSSPGDGCEINIATNTKNCGGCGAMGSDCGSKYANATSTCSMSACTTPKCNAGYGDCTGGLADGCETNTTNTAAHCGGCGQGCAQGSAAHVSSDNCVASQCDPKCVGSYDACDTDKFNGCETNTDDDKTNCGGCSTTCSEAASAHVTANNCVGGACDPSCAGSYGDCDSSRTNGCEVDTASSKAHCGGCAMPCSEAASAHVTANNCSGSDCHPACSTGYDDCDSNGHNGCEKDVSGDVNNCGACKKVCGTTNASGTSCGSSKCSPNCNAGWLDCTAPEDGCETPKGTVTNCTKCGEACSGSTPFCDAGGCVHFRDIVVAPSGVHAIGGWTGSNGNAEHSIDHTLSYAKGNDRMVLVGVATSDPFLEPELVTYDDKPMTRAAFSVDGTSQSWAGIFYILDVDLPATAKTSKVFVKYWNGPQWGHGGLDVIELKNAQQAAPFASGTSSGGNCGSNPSRSSTVTFTSPGADPTKYDKSLVYSVLSARAATSAMMSSSSGLVESWNGYTASPDKLTGAAAYVIDDDTRTITWNVAASCYNTANVILAVQRVTGP